MFPATVRGPEEIELLKDHADIGAQTPQFTLPQRAHLGSVHDDATRAGSLEPVNETYQRALAGPRVTDHGEHVTRVDIERHIVDGGHGLLAHPKGLADVLESDERCRAGHFRRHFSLRICCSILARIDAQSAPLFATVN